MAANLQQAPDAYDTSHIDQALLAPILEHRKAETARLKKALDDAADAALLRVEMKRAAMLKVLPLHLPQDTLDAIEAFASARAAQIIARDRLIAQGFA